MVIAGAFVAGLAWSDRAWEKRWAERDSAESAQEVNAQTAARMIEQGRLIARDEAVKNAQAQTAAARTAAANLSDSVIQLRQQAKTLPPAWTPQATPQVLPLPSEAKQPAPPPEVLADMLGNLAEEARRYAAIADERYTAGMTCERIYESVRTSIPSKG